MTIHEASSVKQDVQYKDTMRPVYAKIEENVDIICRAWLQSGKFVNEFGSAQYRVKEPVETSAGELHLAPISMDRFDANYFNVVKLTEIFPLKRFKDLADKKAIWYVMDVFHWDNFIPTKVSLVVVFTQC